MAEAAARVVAIGVGNRLRADDAAGPAVAARLRERAPGGLVVLERDGDPGALMDAWAGADLALVADAVTSGAPAGEVHRLDATERALPARTFGCSTHAIGLGEAVELARALDRMPRRLVVYGIEGAAWEAGAEPDPAVARAVEHVAAEVLAEACEALGEG